MFKKPSVQEKMNKKAFKRGIKHLEPMRRWCRQIERQKRNQIIKEERHF